MLLKKLFIGLFVGFGLMFNGLFALDFEIYSVYNSDGSYSHTVDSFSLNGTYNEPINIISGTVNVSGETTINDWLNIDGGELRVIGSDLEIQGSLWMDGGTLVLNGNIDINGSLFQNSGSVDIAGGRLNIGQDYHVGAALYTDSAYLHMKSANGYVLVGGNFNMASDKDGYGDLTSGVLEVKGNFTQSGGETTNFDTSLNHKVLLSGDTKQFVHFDTFENRARFNVLEINNTSEEGVEFTSTVSILKNLITTTSKITNLHLMRSNFTLLNDITIDGSLSLSEYSEIHLADNNITITGDLDIDGVRLNLNTSNVHVGGNMNLHGWSRARIDIDSGTLMVDQNLTIGNLGTTVNTFFTMMEDNAYVLVNGDFLIDADEDNYGNLTAGLLEVKGNFTQAGGDATNFPTSGTHKVLLSGDTKQFVHFDTLDGRSHFNVLEINNTSEEGVEFTSTAAIIKNLITTTSKITNLHLIRSNFTLLNDITIDGSLSLSEYSGINFGDKTITINGDFNLSSNLDLNMSTFNIGGDFNYNGGTLHVDSAEVSIGNNFTNTGYASLKMLGEDGYVLVNGDFLAHLSANNYNALTAGTLEIKGDFTHLYYDYGSRYSFVPNGTHTVVLSGNLQQLVNFGSTNSNFNHLNIINTSTEGVEFQTPTRVTGTLTALNCLTPLNLNNVTYGTLNLDGSCTPLSLLVPDSTAYFLTDSGITGERTYNNNGSYTGSIRATDGSVTDVVGTYTVAGNVMTLSRTSPSPLSLVLTYLGEVNGVKNFTVSVNGVESLSYGYDTAAERDQGDIDEDGFTNVEEYEANTDATDENDNPLTAAIMNKTTYFFSTTGIIGDRNYVDDGTYTGNTLLTNGIALIVSGTYDITGKTLTVTRISPSARTTVFTYVSTDTGVTTFELSDNGEVSQSYSFDTEEERDDAMPSENGINPALIMYLLN